MVLVAIELGLLYDFTEVAKILTAFQNFPQAFVCGISIL
jgi:hypothetical protein